jgi:hypothetical protein
MVKLSVSSKMQILAKKPFHFTINEGCFLENKWDMAQKSGAIFCFIIHVIALKKEAI